MGIEFAGPHNDLVVANPDRPQLAPKRFEFEQVNLFPLSLCVRARARARASERV